MVPDLVDPWQDIEFSNNKNKIMIEVSTHPISSISAIYEEWW